MLLSFINRFIVLVTDTNIQNHQVYTTAQRSAFQTALNVYSGDSRVKGFYLKDEPMWSNLEGFANSFKMIKATFPTFDNYVNLVPSYVTPISYIAAPPGKLALSNSQAQDTGTYITPTNNVGQTITIPAGVTYVDGIDFKIDPNTWATNETLSLKVWTTPQKTTLLDWTPIAGKAHFRR
jgi:hypothetical protein